MCGIAGLIGSGLDRGDVEDVLRRFQRDLHHRGPDDCGAFVSRDGVAGLVNTRLAILDLSPAGHQPMSSSDGRYHIVFNGEIYNYAALRAELLEEGCSFSSHCDTEVVLAMFIRYGPESVRELAGMFAFAIWDALEQSCFLARGPLGVKPLYYYQDGTQLIFSSELRAILKSGRLARQLCPSAVRGYLLFGAVPEPLTMVEGVRLLPAGHHATWRAGKLRLRKFWDLQFASDKTSREEATRKLRDALDESVQRHLVSDVPVGVFLTYKAMNDSTVFSKDFYGRLLQRLPFARRRRA